MVSQNVPHKPANAVRLLVRTIAIGLVFVSSPVFALDFVTVHRFAGMPDFQRSRLLNFVVDQQGARLIQNTHIPLFSEEYSCESILALKQFRPLGKMAHQGYINSDSAIQYRKLYEKYFKPDQVSFLELIHSGKKSTILPLPGTNSILQFLLNELPPAHATLALVAGQHFDANTNKLVTTKLPWQWEDHLANVPFDRTKYKFVSEYGRALGDEPGDFDTLIQRALLTQLEEVHAFDGYAGHFGIDDAWASFHFLDEKITAHYEKRIGVKRMQTTQTKEGESLFVVPLRKMFEVFQPEKQSSILQKLLNHGFDIDLAVYMLRLSKQLEQSDLNVSQDGNYLKNPIRLIDASDLYAELMDAAFQEYRNPSTQSVIRQAVCERPLQGFFTPMNQGQQDYALSFGTMQVISDRNAIYLTNLDPNQAMKNPNYVKSMVAGALTYKILLMGNYDPSWNLQKIYDFAVSKNINFIVSTRFADISNQLQQMGFRLFAENSVRKSRRDDIVQALRDKTFTIDHLMPVEEFHHYFTIPLADLIRITQTEVQNGLEVPDVGMGVSMIQRDLQDAGTFSAAVFNEVE